MSSEHTQSAAEAAGEAAAPGPDEGARVGELTEDLQRVTAEYANCRKRAERDRRAAAVQARPALVAVTEPDPASVAAPDADGTGTDEQPSPDVGEVP